MPPGEAEMLAFLGLEGVKDLFEDIPSALRIEGLDLPPGRDEAAAVEGLREILDRNRGGGDVVSFLGAGFYDMYVPAVVDALLSRSEFYTSYTPYQAEISQGLLQALFEYQSLVCELTGMDAANSSMYDGSSALGEAALMCHRITHKREFVVPRLLHPERRAVLESYATGPGLTVKEVDHDPATGLLDPESLGDQVGPETGGLYVENPNLLGLMDPGLTEVKARFPDVPLVVGVQPLSLGIMRPPGDYGADLVVGEGQPLGSWMNYGGPSLGLFACRQEYVRKLPGRVIGRTRDAAGDPAYCMTLQTREQHIRKERAMSNICTNEALLAIGTAVYLAHKGAAGLRALGVQLVEKAQRLMERIGGVEGFTAPLFPGAYFNEFPVAAEGSYAEVHEHLWERGIHGGWDLSPRFPELGPAALFAVTDRHREEDLDRLVRALEEMA